MKRRGDIHISANMNCTIFLDGEKVGATRNTELVLSDIPFGKHVIVGETDRYRATRDVFLGVETLQVKLALEEKGGTLTVRSDSGECRFTLAGDTYTCPHTLEDLKKGVHEIRIQGDNFAYSDRVRIESNRELEYVVTLERIETASREKDERRYRNALALPESDLISMRRKLTELDSIVLHETRFDVSEGIDAHKRLTQLIRQKEREAEDRAKIEKQKNRKRLRKIIIGVVIALFAIVVITVTILLIRQQQRNRMAEAMYHEATAKGTETAYRQYEDQFGTGGPYGEAVREVLKRFEMDHQRFAEAVEKNTADAYAAYLDQFGGNAVHLEEAQARLRVLQLQEKLPEIMKEQGLVRIPGGTIFLGAANSDAPADSNSRPPYYTPIEPFFLSATEVPFRDFDAFCRATGRSLPDDNGFGRGDRPVINVSYPDAMAYCRWLSQKIGLDVRLPSEAEWEYACRAGTSTRFFWGTTMDSRYCHNGRKRGGRTMPVGSTEPNPFGLFDMSGNVYEWCMDFYQDPYDSGKEPYKGSSYSFPNLYEENSSGNPVFKAWGNRRVIRGGSYRTSNFSCGSSTRSGLPPETTRSDLGFRIAVTIPR